MKKTTIITLEVIQNNLGKERDEVYKILTRGHVESEALREHYQDRLAELNNQIDEMTYTIRKMKDVQDE